MQFVANGPHIPETLLQAHEDGRVVFFCGAGISFPAGLPGFGGLTGRIFDELGVEPKPPEKAAMAAGRFDVAIGLLEGRHVGGRVAVRRALADALEPDLSKGKATATHKALLTLGRGRDDRTRLITTNFDRLFEVVIERGGMDVQRFEAPLLPVPKRRWGGLVYLHGRLAERPTPDGLEKLVVSGGDFGLAYLAERWAARFVGELLRNYIVCFVGYSLADPVLRYMTDALAADRLLGERPLDMFAFGNYARGKEQQEADEWAGKNVKPILYRNHSNHYYLHQTLGKWAETYRDGVNGKSRVVLDWATTPPNLAPDRDDVASRVLWALSDPSGEPARQFARMDPVPSLEWLDVLTEVRHGQSDLPRFGVQPHERDDESRTFDFASRPAPVDLGLWMALAGSGADESQWDLPMVWVATWLARHLNDPRLLTWLVLQGGQLHSRFAMEIERQLEETARIEQRGGADLQELLQNAPNAVPTPTMRALWELMLAGRVGSQGDSLPIYAWRQRVENRGFSTRARLELREILAPRVLPRKAIRLDFLDENPEGEERQLDWDLVLCADVERVDFAATDPDGFRLGPLLDVFNALLREAMELMRALREADERDDPSYREQPSIEEHPQNQRFHKWTLLIELARDAWLDVAESNAGQARLAAEGWWRTPYPVFRRLALFAAAQGPVVEVDRAVAWLLEDGGWWLWSVCTHREVSRLLVALAGRLDEEQRQKVEHAIAEGPPRKMYVADLDPERWGEIVDGETWHHLSRLAGGGDLGPFGRRKAAELKARHAEWTLVVDERREFSTWIEQGVERPETATPEDAAELIEWVREHPERDEWNRDDWGRRCKEDYEATSGALRALAKDDWWGPRWIEALYAWTEDDLVERSWKDMSPLLLDAPDELLCTGGASFWLRSVGRVVDPAEDSFVDLCRRVLALARDDDDLEADNPVDRALNRPAGQVVEGLLDWALRQEAGVPTEVKRLLESVCDPKEARYRVVRVVVASRALALLVRDEEWTRGHVLPMFDWRRSNTEACTAWRGFLWAPRYHEGFLESVRESFVQTASHYGDLGSHGGQYAGLLTYTGLQVGGGGWNRDLRYAVNELPDAGLQQVLSTLGRTLEPDERREDYFRNRVLPFLQRVWPKTTDRLTAGVSAGFARLCLVSDDAFPQVLGAVRDYLKAGARRAPGYVFLSFKDKGYADRFPAEALEFLDLVLVPGAGVFPEDLRSALRAIRAARPDLAETTRFQSLLDLTGGTLE